MWSASVVSLTECSLKTSRISSGDGVPKGFENIVCERGGAFDRRIYSSAQIRRHLLPVSKCFKHLRLDVSKNTSEELAK